MATSRSTMGADTRPIHPAFVKAALSAEAAKKRVERVADILVKLMEEIHGGDWRVSIDHEPNAAVLVVAPRPERHQRPRNPQPEIA